MNLRRARPLRSGPGGGGPVLYWMHREHRTADNWGLLLARDLAIGHGRPLAVVHCLDPAYPAATLRSFGFLLRGLRATEARLRELGIPLFSLLGEPCHEIPALAERLHVSALVTDFDPLRHKQAWVEAVAREVRAPVWEVDSRNIVPCRLASAKKEWAARTIRPKIHRLLPEFLEEPPALAPHPHPWPEPVRAVDWDAVLAALRPDAAVPEVSDFTPGEAAALARLRDFLRSGLNGYDRLKNDPNHETSRLSPYLHFGQLSSLRVALEVVRARGETGIRAEARDAFLEELIVRRELADNFCLREPDYDTMAGFPDWARRTLEKHAGDPRGRLHSPAELEAGRSGDPLWNAAQRQMVRTGHMHGWLRMYWAKQLLWWTGSAEQALEFGLRLNDRWNLDGRDPNGYAGLAWSLGGVHDRPWGERPVFGTVRSMTPAGAARKFDVAAFVRAWDGELGRD